MLSTRRTNHLGILQPSVRIYTIALLVTSAQRVANLGSGILLRRKGVKDAVYELREALRTATDPRCFPIVCVILIGGPTWASATILKLLSKATPAAKSPLVQTLIKFSSSSVAAAIGFKLLNSDPRLHRPRRTRPTLRHGRHSSGTVRSRRGSQQTKLVTDCAGPNGEPQSPANGEKGSLSPAEDGLYDGMPTFLAGHNIDITLFAFVRALDSLFSSLKPESKKPTRRGSQSSFQMDAVLMLFIVCCGPIMKAWFYAPARLSPTLAAFITKVALLDPRILDALRKCRTGEWTYGSERIESLAAVCREEGIPERWGDPSQSIPLKKEWFECGIGLVERSPKLGVEGKGHVPSPFYQAVSKYVRGHASSEKHAALRFFQAWSFVFVRMLPLQLTVSTVRLVQLARKGASLGQYIKVLFNACWMTAKRSSVLGLFAGLIYYGVSLGRYRIGPRIIELMLKMRDMIYGEKLEGRGQPWFKLLFGQERVAGRIAYQAYLKKQLRQSTGKTTPEEKAEHFAAARRVEAAQMIDGGLAVTLGCWMSGLALLIEQPSRRVEMMLLAAPHAFGTLVPRRYDPKHLWLEHLTFTFSAATILTTFEHHPGKVRGVFGKMLNYIMEVR